jgi:hypothetical protein
LRNFVFGVWPIATNMPGRVDVRLAGLDVLDAHAGHAALVVAEHFVDHAVPHGLTLGWPAALGHDRAGAHLVARLR